MSRRYNRGWWDGFVGRKTYGQGYREGKKAASGCGCLVLIVIALIMMKSCS